MLLPDFQYPSIVLYYSVFAIMLGFAGWKLYLRHKGATGGEPELYATLVKVFCFFLAGGLYSRNPPIFSNVDLVALLVDMVLVVSFVAIAMNANRIWPLVAAGAHLVVLFSHFSRALQMEIDPWAYSLLRMVPMGVALICIIIGFVGHFQRYRKYGYDYDWVDWARIRKLESSRG